MIKKFISKVKIKKRVLYLGDEITKFYKSEELIIISILKGSFIFTADLIREIKLPIKVDFLEASSYNGLKISSGKVEIKKDISIDIKNKNILLVEDIIDTGFSLDYIIKKLKMKKPKSIQICTLLLKKEKHKLKNPIRFVGFDIEDEFVVGYGMDYKGIYRNLNYIGKIEE